MLNWGIPSLWTRTATIRKLKWPRWELVYWVIYCCFTTATKNHHKRRIVKFSPVLQENIVSWCTTGLYFLRICRLDQKQLPRKRMNWKTWETLWSTRNLSCEPWKRNAKALNKRSRKLWDSFSRHTSCQGRLGYNVKLVAQWQNSVEQLILCRRQ